MPALLAVAAAAAATAAVAGTAGSRAPLPHMRLDDLLAPPVPPPTPNLTALQAVVDAKSLQYNLSLSVGVFHPTFKAFGVAGGLADRVGRVTATTDSRYPVGSVTKPWTAAAVLQLYEKGVIDIDKPIAPYVDGILMRGNGTTMAQLWNNDPNISLVTPRLLMGMRAGLNDYNDTWYKLVTENDPTFDVTPYDLLHTLDKNWTCPPGTCGKYASTGFELLGLLLAQAYNCSTWEEYDQLSVIPDNLRPQFNRTAFPGRGLCSAVPDVVHQYDVEDAARPLFTRSSSHGSLATFASTADPDVAPPATPFVKIVDLYNDSCLNGWACGNIAAAPIDIARFHYYLHRNKIVSNVSVAAMMDWKPMTQGWEPQLYGLALMQTFPPRGFEWAPDPLNHTYTVGHAGADYGSYSQLAGYNWHYGFGIAVTSNAVMSLNCSSIPVDGSWWDDAVCGIYDEVLQITSAGAAPRLNCSLCSAEGSTCAPTPPKSPLCPAAMETACGANKSATTLAECTRCIALNRANLTKEYGCQSDDLLGFCPPNTVCEPVMELFCGTLKPNTTNTTGPTPPRDPACWECVYKENLETMLEAQCSTQVMEQFCTPEPQNSTACYPYLEATCLPALNLGACAKCASANRLNATRDANCSYPQVVQFCHDSAPFLSTCDWQI